LNLEPLLTKVIAALGAFWAMTGIMGSLPALCYDNVRMLILLIL